MKIRLAALLALILYTLLLVKVMVLKDMPLVKIGNLMLNFGGINPVHSANFIPLTTILPYLFGFKGLIIAGINLVGNIVLLIPIGFLVPFVYRNVSWRKISLISVLSGLFIETMQVILEVGIFDIDDVILNALGVVIGYSAFLLGERMVSAMSRKRIIIVSIEIIAILIPFIYLGYIKFPIRLVFDHQPQTVSTEIGKDLCGGTGGTGEIVSKSNDVIAIKSRKGETETIKVNNETEVKNSQGEITFNDLQVGDHVTVVIMSEERIADAILVCKTQ